MQSNYTKKYKHLFKFQFYIRRVIDNICCTNLIIILYYCRWTCVSCKTLDVSWVSSSDKIGLMQKPSGESKCGSHDNGIHVVRLLIERKCASYFTKLWYIYFSSKALKACNQSHSRDLLFLEHSCYVSQKHIPLSMVCTGHQREGVFLTP